MKYNEAAVFKWVLIFGAAVASGVALTLLTNGLGRRPLGPASWRSSAASTAIRWTREWWRNSRDLPGGPDHSP